MFKNQADVTGIKKLTENKYQFNVFPNPANDELIIEQGNLEDAITGIKIINTIGEIVFQEQPGNFSQERGHQLSVKHLPSGTYFVICETKAGITTQKISVVK